MIKVKSQVSRFDIFEHLTEEQIFKYYIPDFIEVKKKFKSPFTSEKTPSCSIFNTAGRLFFKDFSTGYGGDCVNFVMKKYNLTYEEALTVISNDFGLGKIVQESHLKNKPSIIVKSRDEILTSKSFAKIRVKYKKFSTRGLDYWRQYGYTEQELNIMDISELSHYWINGHRFHCDLAFAYNFSWYSPYTYKILQPFEAKEYKWFSNCPDTLLQGFNLLPLTGDMLLVTSSYKDVGVLRRLGYNAIAPAAESVIPKAITIDYLKDKFIKVIPYMNNDIPGVGASYKYKDQYGLNFIVNPEGLPKDPSDLIKHGYNLDVILKEMLLHYEENI